jgi:Protein of unknown function (DUF3800)
MLRQRPPTIPTKTPAAVAPGRKGGLKGGKARAERMTPKHRADIARKAAKARWSNLVRLVYLDEAGISHEEPALAVAGVIIHGDTQAMEVEKQLDLVRWQHIPEDDWDKVIFHAKDIYHGSKYFDKRKPQWSEKWKRWLILVQLAAIIESMKLPIVAGIYRKEGFGGTLPDAMASALADDSFKKLVIHGSAAVDCVIWTDRWLERFAPDENAVIVAEDNDYIKKALKNAVRCLRSDRLMDAEGFDSETKKRLGLPLKRIIDTPHFAAKIDAPALQLADLVAFTMGRLSKNKPVVTVVSDVLQNQLQWIKNVRVADSSEMEQSS